VDERGGAAPEHRDVRVLLYGHHGGGQIDGELMPVGEGAGRGVASIIGTASSFRGGADELGDLGWVGDHRDVCGRYLHGGGSHPAGEQPLGVGRDGLVLGGDQVPRRQRLPAGTPITSGKTKHRLIPDPLRGPVVAQIFPWP
jgi:hypothetical protein